MSTMLHENAVPFALPVNFNDKHGIGLHSHLSTVLEDDVNGQMGLC